MVNKDRLSRLERLERKLGREELLCQECGETFVVYTDSDVGINVNLEFLCLDWLSYQPEITTHDPYRRIHESVLRAYNHEHAEQLVMKNSGRPVWPWEGDTTPND